MVGLNYLAGVLHLSTEPIASANALSTHFADLGLAEPILRAIHDAGYTTPTPIQAQAIPQVLTGGDLLAAHKPALVKLQALLCRFCIY